MPADTMQAYLAEKYMSGAKADAILSRAAPQKKRKKRKADTAGTSAGFKVRDEDDGWQAHHHQDDAEEESEVVVASDRSFKKRKAGEGWETLREGDKPESPPPIDEQPVVVETQEPPPPPPPVGGLLTSDQIKKKFGRKKAEVQAEKPAEAEETVYRDSSGRKIDTKAARAEAARLRREEEEREAKKMEWGKGFVQREDKERRREQMEKDKNKDIARYANDRELNEEQKAQQRWNDPAAAFLTNRNTKGPRKPTYNGPTPPPNRFGIKPGHRWDGVDRSNGFEKKLFQRLNETRRSKTEYHAWSVEDM